MNKLKFSPGKGNAKLKSLGGVVYTISLLSGWSCPGAKDCLHKVVRDSSGQHLEAGKDVEFRCFSASQENAYPAVYEQRKHNFDALRAAKGVAEKATLIAESLPKDATIIRIHVGGDFYSQEYFDAWLLVAKSHPAITFYAYTKSVNYWVARINEIPINFKLNASRGGKHDQLIDQHSLKSAEVVFSEKEALDKGLPIDHDDTHAFLQDNSFALLLHGVQPKGSKAAAALKELKGVGSYSKPKSNKNGKTNKSLASV